MSLETAAEYKRRRREQSMDFKLYQAANMRACRARKEAAELAARVEEAEQELQKLREIVALHTAFPLRDGMMAAAAGIEMDPAQSEDWQRGYKLGQRR